jgi:hypothetical protein
MEPKQRMSPFTALFLGTTAVAVAVITSLAIIVIYGMHLAGQSCGGLVGVAEKAVQGLPDLAASLPPAIGDLLNDRRAPDYVKDLAIDVHWASGETGRDLSRPIVSVQNKGAQMITLLTMRVAALDSDNEPVHEWTTAAATPLTVEHEWRGPILPSGERRYALHRLPDGSSKDTTLKWEVTDVRVWSAKGGSGASPSSTAEAITQVIP